MTIKTNFQDEHYEITLLGNRALRISMKGFLKTAHLPAVTNFMEILIKDHQIDKLMVDQSGLRVLTKDVQLHMAKTMSSMTSKSLKRVAIVEAKDVFAKRATEKLHETQQGNAIAKIFDSEEKSLNWLMAASINLT